MENRTLVAIIAIVGVAFLAVHAGCINGLVSGGKNIAPVVQTPASGVLSPVLGAQSPAGAVQPPASAGAGVQKTFALKSVGGQYDPAVIRVNQGDRVRIVGDPSTLSGCMAVVNIESYGISKYIRQGDNVIEFTADKTGTFPMYCNMGIGSGKLIVG